MRSAYQPLPVTTLQLGATYHRPPQILPARVTLEDPAINVMTDLSKVAAVTISPDASMDEANQKMIANKVRLLLVTDAENAVLGLITATDILGEKPLLHMRRSAGDRADIQVRDLMTPAARLEVLQMVDVEKAHVGDVVASLTREGRQHALVVDVDEASLQQMVRGLFSATQISRQLGIAIGTAEIARTFAELETVLGG